jgi:hypothetical protein
VLAGGVMLAAYAHFSNRTYVPIARVQAPEGVVYTAFANETRGREACDAANARFVEPLVQQCPQCRIAFARCADREEAIALQLAAQRSYTVAMPGLRISVDGAPELARASCEAVAASVAQHGMDKARCAPPRTSPLIGDVPRSVSRECFLNPIGVRPQLAIRAAPSAPRRLRA